MLPVQIYENSYENKWCPGCGNFGILEAMKMSLAEMEIAPDKVLIVSGIGQAAKTPHFLNCNLFHGLHGRALPIASGAKLANHDLTVLVNSGDGDCYGEGMSHFVHAVRRNIDITLLVHNNKIYGLTKGQASPTSEMGTITAIQNKGVISETLNPVNLSLSLGVGFVARGFSNDSQHLRKLIVEAVNYKGFSLIDILQPCVTYNKINTHGWYKKRVYDLAETDHRTDDFEKALSLSREWEEKIPVGVIYKKEKSSFIDRIDMLSDGPLIDRSHAPEALGKLTANLYL